MSFSTESQGPSRTPHVLRLVRDATEKSTGQLKPTSDRVEKAAELAETLTNLFEAQKVAWLMHVAVDDHENAYRIALRAFRNHPTRIQPAFWARRSALQAGMYREAVDIMEAGMERVSERNDSPTRLNSPACACSLDSYQSLFTPARGARIR